MLLLIAIAAIPHKDQSLAVKVKHTITEMNMIPSTTSFSYATRHMQTDWGLQIFKDNMLNGAGAGAWNALYHRYQDYLFWTTETHNHFVQVAIETGIIGLMSFLAMWAGLLFITGWRAKRFFVLDNKNNIEEQTGKWILNWGVACAAILIGVHAFFDFDLSLGAMDVLLWSLLALANSGAVIDSIFQPKAASAPWLLFTAGIVLTALLMIMGARNTIAYNLFLACDKSMQTAAQMKDGLEKEKELKRIQEMAEQAEKLDNNNALYPATVAQACALRFLPLARPMIPGLRN